MPPAVDRFGEQRGRLVTYIRLLVLQVDTTVTVHAVLNHIGESLPLTEARPPAPLAQWAALHNILMEAFVAPVLHFTLRRYFAQPVFCFLLLGVEKPFFTL